MGAAAAVALPLPVEIDFRGRAVVVDEEATGCLISLLVVGAGDGSDGAARKERRADDRVGPATTGVGGTSAVTRPLRERAVVGIWTLTIALARGTVLGVGAGWLNRVRDVDELASRLASTSASRRELLSKTLGVDACRSASEARRPDRAEGCDLIRGGLSMRAGIWLSTMSSSPSEPPKSEPSSSSASSGPATALRSLSSESGTS
jgi:hypothetical protein